MAEIEAPTVTTPLISRAEPRVEPSFFKKWKNTIKFWSVVLFVLILTTIIEVSLLDGWSTNGKYILNNSLFRNKRIALNLML